MEIATLEPTQPVPIIATRRFIAPLHASNGEIDVLDRGAGFGDVDPEQLFQAFHTTKKSGTGLGLAIVRRLVTLQGGSVTLHAREGGGAVARVTLLLAPHSAR